jgi:pilus assembly protein CpaF
MAKKKAFGTFGRKPSGLIASALAQSPPAKYLGDKVDLGLEEGGEEVVALEVNCDATDQPIPQKRILANTISQRDKQDWLFKVKDQVLPILLSRIDVEPASLLERDELEVELEPVIHDVIGALKLTLNRQEFNELIPLILDEMVGFGPLERLLADEAVSDILVNGPKQIYIEKGGKLVQSDLTFRNNEHVQEIATRICNKVGRNVNISSPIADARLPDGSRVNVILPPLSLKGTAISIRKFRQDRMQLDDLVDRDSLSVDMARFLKIATLARMNIVISGGTGSGKTTMLNALSQFIHPGERIVTIEDAAELQLKQPHVLPLETRPANLEGQGAITIRDLLINSLRMRPDRIILGEVRGDECAEMLQAFNTGHDGGMCTIHSNSPRDAITRMENLLQASGSQFPIAALRRQILDAVDIIVQVKRLRDGSRKVISIEELVGMEGTVVTSQTLYNFDYNDNPTADQIEGDFVRKATRLHNEKCFVEAGLGDNIKELYR